MTRDATDRADHSGEPHEASPAIATARPGDLESPDRAGAVTPLDPQLLVRAAELARGSRAPATWQAYERDWARFAQWCRDRGLVALPAAPSTVVAWLADQAPTWRPATDTDPLDTVVEGHVLVAPGLRPATLARRLAAVSVAHQAAATTDPDTELPNPAEHPSVRAVMAGIRRHPGVAPTRRRTPARSITLNAMTEGLDPQHSAVDARDLALLYLGMSGALRRSDLARLDLDDLTTTPSGLLIRDRRSKTDQEGHGTQRGVAADPDGACATADALELWRSHLGRAGIAAGALWRPIHRAPSGRLTIRARRLSGHAINDIVARRAAQAGLDGDYGSHSLRRGFVHDALEAGSTEHAVMHHGGWRSATVMRGYADEVNTFAATNPTRGLGLRRPGHDRPGHPAAPPGPDGSGTRPDGVR